MVGVICRPGMNLAICLVPRSMPSLVLGCLILRPPTRAVIMKLGCVAQEVSQGKPEQCTGLRPGGAGRNSAPGDVVVKGR